MLSKDSISFNKDAKVEEFCADTILKDSKKKERGF